MAFTQYGPPELGDWVPQPDFQAEQSKEGGWTATQSFQILRGSLDLETFQDDFRINRPIEDLYPEIEGFWRFLGLASIPRVKHIPGGYSMISVKFAGYTGPSGSGTEDDEPEPVPTYALRGGVTERSIMLHPAVLAVSAASDDDLGILLSLISGVYEWSDPLETGALVCSKFIDEQSHVTWRPLVTQPSAGDAETFARLISKGYHTYKFPTFTWEKTWESTVPLTAEEVNNLGYIDLPDGDPPEIDGDRDWMLVNATQEQDGLKYRCTKEWELSDRGGWSADIYLEL